MQVQMWRNYRNQSEIGVAGDENQMQKMWKSACTCLKEKSSNSGKRDHDRRRKICNYLYVRKEKSCGVIKKEAIKPPLI